MPYNTGWAGERRPTILDRWGIAPWGKGVTGGAQRPRGLLWGMCRGMESPSIAGLGGIQPRDSRNGGHTAPKIAGPTDTESLGYEAVWHRVSEESGSRAAGESAEEGCEAPG